MLFALQHISVVLQLHSIFLVLTSWHAKQKKKKIFFAYNLTDFGERQKRVVWLHHRCCTHSVDPKSLTSTKHILAARSVGCYQRCQRPLQLHHRCCTVTVCTHNPDPHSAALFLSECKSADTWCGKIHWLWRRTEKSRARCITGAALTVCTAQHLLVDMTVTGSAAQFYLWINLTINPTFFSQILWA